MPGQVTPGHTHTTCRSAAAPVSSSEELTPSRQRGRSGCVEVVREAFDVGSRARGAVVVENGGIEPGPRDARWHAATRARFGADRVIVARDATGGVMLCLDRRGGAEEVLVQARNGHGESRQQSAEDRGQYFLRWKPPGIHSMTLGWRSVVVNEPTAPPSLRFRDRFHRGET